MGQSGPASVSYPEGLEKLRCRRVGRSASVETAGGRGYSFVPMAAKDGMNSETEPSAPAAPVGLWHRFAFQSVRVALWALAKVLTLDGLYAFGRGFGTLEWCINYKRRRAFAGRLEPVFGAELTSGLRRRATLRHFQLSRCDKIFYLILDMLPREKVLKRFHIEGVELLDAGLRHGNGVYVTLSHHGAHHIAGLCGALRGYRVAGVRDRREGPIRRFIQRKYDQKYAELRSVRIFFADAYPRELYRCLKDNFVLASALDVHRSREAHQKTIPVTVFGGQRDFLTGTLQIALRCGSTVLQCFVLSEPGFHYRVKLIGPLVPPERNGETPEVIAEAMRTYAANIEAYSRQYPAHISRG